MDTRRDFIFVDDLIDCVMKAIDGEGRAGPYHISSGSDYSIKELYDATIKALELDASTRSRCARATRTTRRRSCSTPLRPSATSTGA